MHIYVCIYACTVCSVYRMDTHPDRCKPLLVLCVPGDPPVLGCLLARSVVLGLLLEHTLEVLYRLDGLDVLPLCSRDVEVDLVTVGVSNDHLTMLVQPDADPAEAEGRAGRGKRRRIRDVGRDEDDDGDDGIAARSSLRSA